MNRFDCGCHAAIPGACLCPERSQEFGRACCVWKASGRPDSVRLKFDYALWLPLGLLSGVLYRVAGPVRTLVWTDSAEEVHALLQGHVAGDASEPLLIKGAAAHWPAVQKWSLDWLARHHSSERRVLGRGGLFLTSMQHAAGTSGGCKSTQEKAEVVGCELYNRLLRKGFLARAGL